MQIPAPPKYEELLGNIYQLPLEEFLLCVEALKGHACLCSPFETKGTYLECITEFPYANSLRQAAACLGEEEFKRLMVEFDRRPRLESKRELLAKYSARPLTGFAQFNAWVLWSNGYDERGFAQVDMVDGVPTNELMRGNSSVRVLVRSGTAPDTALRLLERIVSWLKSDPNLISRFSPAKR